MYALRGFVHSSDFLHNFHKTLYSLPTNLYFIDSSMNGGQGETTSLSRILIDIYGFIQTMALEPAETKKIVFNIG